MTTDTDTRYPRTLFQLGEWRIVEHEPDCAVATRRWGTRYSDVDAAVEACHRAESGRRRCVLAECIERGVAIRLHMQPIKEGVNGMVEYDVHRDGDEWSVLYRRWL